MSQYISINNLQVSSLLHQFIEQELLPLTSLDASKFWEDFACIISELTPVNKALLAKRESLQAQN